MKIDVARLSEGGETFEGEDPVEILEWADDDEAMHPVGPVKYSLRAVIAGPELLVRGSVSAKFDGICVRCGDKISFEARENKICISFPLNEELLEVDLTPELRESILFALPSHPVCRPDCPGLCPRCGRRLDSGPCGCAPSADAGWNAFSILDSVIATDEGKKPKAPGRKKHGA